LIKSRRSEGPTLRLQRTRSPPAKGEQKKQTCEGAMKDKILNTESLAPSTLYGRVGKRSSPQVGFAARIINTACGLFVCTKA